MKNKQKSFKILFSKLRKFPLRGLAGTGCCLASVHNVTGGISKSQPPAPFHLQEASQLRGESMVILTYSHL